jgi:hypothetical protein
MAELLKFKFTAVREAIWGPRNRKVPAGTVKAIMAFESHEDAMFFLGRIEWSAWKLVPVEAEKTPATPDKSLQGRK